MLTQEAIKHFKNKMRLAKALGIARQSIQDWGNAVPLQRAFLLQDMTKGKLKVKLDLYRREGGVWQTGKSRNGK